MSSELACGLFCFTTERYGWTGNWIVCVKTCASRSFLEVPHPMCGCSNAHRDVCVCGPCVKPGTWLLKERRRRCMKASRALSARTAFDACVFLWKSCLSNWWAVVAKGGSDDSHLGGDRSYDERWTGTKSVVPLSCGGRSQRVASDFRVRHLSDPEPLCRQHPQQLLHVLDLGNTHYVPVPGCDQYPR